MTRRTVASICGVDPSRDLAAAIFTLEPGIEAAQVPGDAAEAVPGSAQAVAQS